MADFVFKCTNLQRSESRHFDKGWLNYESTKFKDVATIEFGGTPTNFFLSRIGSNLQACS